MYTSVLFGGVRCVYVTVFALGAAMRVVGTESRRAARRVLLVNGSITQVRASHWVPGGKTCPHCRLEDETVSHRLWSCLA